ncbi:hypothetical protein F441_07121 [Phytophthora nicotianae CJ01A1]|uniref:Uncharacterized protein n=1 Tax=Phytophthora nicotianae CJ01A1 TaxID=1317063 RepID=W2X849_PHYNI|nr:hypothetical protein F441_07121 [Phytophthora nicotianae CJ01A1]
MQNIFAMLRTSTLKHKTQLYTLVYNFAAATCDGIKPKSIKLLHRRWEGLKRAQNRDKTKKVDVIVDDRDMAVGISQTEPTNSAATLSNRISRLLQPDEESKSPASSRQLNTTEHDFNVGTENTVHSEPVSACLASTEASPIADNQSANLMSETLSTIVDMMPVLDDTLANHLLDIASKFPKHTPGKWPLLLAEFRRLKPQSVISQNALRKRLEKYQKRKHPGPEAVTAPAVELPVLNQTETTASVEANPNKRPPPACSSCRERKRKCGPSSTNPQCERRKIAQYTPISSFFSQT